MTTLIFFILAVSGMAQIIVDGSIFDEVREWIQKHFPKKISQILDCYLCTGTWCGFFLGWVTGLGTDAFAIFACGCAGGFVAASSQVLLQYIDSLTIKNLGKNG